MTTRSRSRSPRSKFPRSDEPIRRRSPDVVEEVKKEKPNFGLSGVLAADSKTQNGTVLKYHEPSEAALPKNPWRIYVYKGKEELDMYPISRKTSYLFGRDHAVADVPTDHSSCSKQHAAIQFRETKKKNEYGDVKISVKPYLIDLESTNKSYVNDKEIPGSRYYELRTGDTLRFGDSTREYVVLMET